MNDHLRSILESPRGTMPRLRPAWVTCIWPCGHAIRALKQSRVQIGEFHLLRLRPCGHAIRFKIGVFLWVSRVSLDKHGQGRGFASNSSFQKAFGHILLGETRDLKGLCVKRGRAVSLVVLWPAKKKTKSTFLGGLQGAPGCQGYENGGGGGVGGSDKPCETEPSWHHLPRV